MQNNRILAVAIASTLSVSSGVAYGSFENVRDGMTPATLNSVYTPRRPLEVFDFGTETAIRVPDSAGTNGVVYASELFGDARTLPSGENSQGAYAAVVYGIDGEVTNDFEITFTLTNGATFDGDPLLGIDDSGLGGAVGDGTVTGSYAAGTNNVVMENNTTFALVAPDDIFRFSSHGTLYKVTGVSNEPDGSKNYLAFEQVGTGTGQATASAGLTQAVDGSSISVTLHQYAPDANEAVAEGNLVVLNVEGRAGTSIAVTANPANGPFGNNMVAVTAGRDNLIEGAYYHIGSLASDNMYQVTSKPTGYQGNVILNSNLSDSFAAAAYNITRIYKQGDTIIHVGNVAAFKTGEKYQIANHTQFYEVSKTDTTTGNNVITINELGKSTGLAADIAPGANDIPVYRQTAFTLSSGAEGWKNGGTYVSSITAATGVTPALPLKAKTNTGSGKSTATFLIPASKETDLNLKTGDRMMLLYKLGNTKALAGPGQKINMQVSLKTPLTGILVNPARELTVASSKPGVKTVDLKKLEAGNIKISVLSESKEFTGDGTVFVGTNEAKIGTLDIENEANVMAADGESAFEVGKTGALADKSTLKIADGQFAASLKSPGKVFILAGTTNLQADTVTETEATWNLHDTSLQTIAATLTSQTAIHFMVDGQTPINVPENDPTATLLIDFDDTKMTDITRADVELRKIKKDGTVCHVLHLPNSAAKDILSLRVTNDSSQAGKLTIAVYDMEGTEVIAPGTELFGGEEIKQYETKRITATDLEELAGGPWSGRARGVISSTLPKLEIFNYLRENVPGAPLTNQSVGADGNNCQQ